MRLSSRWHIRRMGRGAGTPIWRRVRLPAAGAIGVLIWLVWLAGMLVPSRETEMLALSGIAVLGSGLVIELRRLRRAGRKVRDNERRYRFLVDNSFDMIVRFDPETQRRTYVSPACRRLYGYEPEEAIALAAEEIIHPEDMPAVREALARLDAGVEQPPVLYRGRCKDGRYIWVEAGLRLFKDRETGAVEGVCVVRDIAERIRYEAELRQAKDEADAASRSKSAFLATMSHELRTPLNAIIGFADIMQNEIMGPVGSEQYRAYMADIHGSGMHLLQLINDILDLTKAEAGKLELHEEIVDLAEAVRSVARVTRGQTELAGLKVVIDLPTDLLLLRADSRKTRQVLFNLIGNAAKFTPRGGSIRIHGRVDAQTGVSITVSDSGIGIASDNLARVFEAFVQVDSSLSRRHSGTGLGLPTAKAIMELHDGRLELRSALGKGTDATVIFPPERIVTNQSELACPVA